MTSDAFDSILLEDAPAILDDAADDFGHVVHRRARAVVRPSTVAEIARIVVEARRRRVPLAVRGSGHSVLGQSQVEGGWVVDLGRLRDVVVDAGTALAGAGASWRDVVRATMPAGLAPPVLTDYAGLAVGGTLAVGGFGGGSYRHGVQADNVLELTVVTGTGDVVICSPRQEPALFDACRAGLGQVAIVARARLRLVATAARVRHYLLPYAELDELLADLETLAEAVRFEQLSGVGTIDGAGRWSYRIDAVKELDAEASPGDDELLAGCSVGRAGVVTSDWSYVDYADRLELPFADLRAAGLWAAPHPWVDVLVPAATLSSFGREVVSSLRPEELGIQSGMLLLYPVRRGPMRAPLLPAPGGEARHYLFDVLRCTPGVAAETLAALVDANRRIYQRCLAFGGALYPISALAMTPADWRRHFGSCWDALRAAKARFDPDHVLGNGWTSLTDAW
jgi:FAD/FMN-containing dehydrogenase